MTSAWALVSSMIEELSRSRSLTHGESQALEWVMKNANQINGKVSWLADEDHELLALIKSGHTAQSVADKTGRSLFAIKTRIHKLRKINGKTR